MPVLELVRPDRLHGHLLRADAVRVAPVTAGPLVFGRSRLTALAFLDAARPVPPLVLCALCGGPAEERCACLTEPVGCGCARVDFETEGRALSDEDLVLLAERYGWLDGRPKTVLEVARARRTTRSRVRAREGAALRKLRQLVLAAAARLAG